MSLIDPASLVPAAVKTVLLWVCAFAASLLLIASLHAQPVIPPPVTLAKTPAEASNLILALVADANAATSRGQYNLAAARLTDAYNLLDLANDDKLERNVLNSLATLYYDNDQLMLAGQYYRKLLALDQKSGDEAALSVSYFNLGHVAASLQQYDEADNLLQQALDLSRKLGDASGEAYATKALGVNAQAAGQLPRAESLLVKAKEQFAALKDDKQRAAVLRNLGDLALQMHQPRQAIGYYQDAVPILIDGGLASALTRTYRGLGLAYEELRDFESALKMQRTYAALLQSELEQRGNENAQRLREELDVRHYIDNNNKLETLTNNQQTRLEQQQKLMQLELLVSVLAVAVVGLLGYLLWRRNQMTKLLHNLANTDELTGINNRRAVIEAGRQEWQRAKRYSQASSVLVFDVDHFKSINDTWGHAKGDEVLKAITATVSDMMRQTDSLGRIGGEEFLLITGNTDLLQAQSLAERIRLRVAGLGFNGMDDRKVTISIGLAGYQPNLTFEQTVQLADRALYHAKQSGRNRCSVYHSGLGQVPVKTAEPPQLKLVEPGSAAG